MYVGKLQLVGSTVAKIAAPKCRMLGALAASLSTTSQDSWHVNTHFAAPLSFVGVSSIRVG